MHRIAANIGDLYSSPNKNFITLKSANVHFREVDVGWPGNKQYTLIANMLQEYNVIIVGGGGLIGCYGSYWDTTIQMIGQNNKLFKVIWGAGLNSVSEPDQSLPDFSYVYQGFDVVRLRDSNTENPLLDSSCMNPMFDELDKPTSYKKIGYFVHSSHPEFFDHINLTSYKSHNECFGYGGIIENNKCTLPVYKSILNSVTNLDLVKNFLQNVDIVVTSSYHGLYWSTMAEKKVIALPFMYRLAKVRLFQYQPTYYSGNLLEDIEKTVPYHNILDTCRINNVDMYNQVFSSNQFI